MEQLYWGESNGNRDVCSQDNSLQKESPTERIRVQ